MNKTANLQVGFARVNVNPQMGMEVRGYYQSRKAIGVLDDLELNVVAVNHGDDTVLIMALDNCNMPTDFAIQLRTAISEKTSVPTEAIFIHSIHTHTGPDLDYGYDQETDNLITIYRSFLVTRFVDACTFAIADLKPAKMGYGVGQAPNIAFIRRFWMKDGSVRTNPGVNNPDILEPIGKLDESVYVMRFDRENAKSVTVVNFACHPDTVGGCYISADWPGFARRFVEKAIEDTYCIFFNGAEGDVNHVNVRPMGGDFNDLEEGFDGCSRGYGHARHMGRVVAGAVMQVYDKVNYQPVDSVKYMQQYVDIPANVPNKEDMPLARKYYELHKAGKDNEIPYKGMMLTTVVAEASRMIRLENAPLNFSLLFSAIKIGNVAMFGIPGEPFNGVARAISEKNDLGMVMTTCMTNAAGGYYPTQDAYDQGGYEAKASNFKAGVAERIVEVGLSMIEKMKQ